ncbi:MAG: serpin family protein [Acidimicrobiales bacterium]
MRRLPILVAVPFLALAACGTSGSDGGEAGVIEPTDGLGRADLLDDAPTTNLANGFNDAGFDLLRTLPADESTVFSPTSIGHALLMARAAADEPTGANIDAGFALPEGIAAHDAWNAIDQAIAASNGQATSNEGAPTPVVTIADRIWPRQGLTVDADWIDLLATHHGAGAETIDVAKPEESRQRINAWVSDQTNELIPSLLPEGFIDGNTNLVLTDALYFKAQWQTVFGKYGTIDRDFTNIDGSSTPTSFMRELELTAPRGIGDGWAAAELPTSAPTIRCW